jgi:hypothetical protein
MVAMDQASLVRVTVALLGGSWEWWIGRKLVGRCNI